MVQALPFYSYAENRIGPISHVSGLFYQEDVMELSGRWEKNARVLTLSGEFQKTEWVLLEAAILSAQIAGRSRIILNIEQVSFPDRAVWAKLLFLCLQYHRKGIRLTFVTPQQWIRQRFERTTVARLADYYSSEQEALLAA
jgi:anti-anti-sigma regulatory factor